MIIFILIGLIIGYLLYQAYRDHGGNQDAVIEQGSKTGVGGIIYPMGSIDPISLFAANDPYKPVLDVQSVYLHVDESRHKGTNGLHALYNLQQVIQDKMGERAGYLVDVRNRDGNVLPVPFNRKTILMYPSAVGF